MEKVYQIFVVDDMSDGYGFSPVCRIFGDYKKAESAALEYLEQYNKNIREQNEKYADEPPYPEHEFIGLVVHNGENVDNFPSYYGWIKANCNDVYIVEFNVE